MMRRSSSWIRRPCRHQGRGQGRPGNHHPGRQGRARHQGRGPDDLHQPGRPLPGTDAQQSLVPAACRARSRAMSARNCSTPSTRSSSRPAWADRAHRWRGTRPGRAAVGSRLPAATVERDQEAAGQQEGTLPDLPGKQSNHSRLRDYLREDIGEILIDDEKVFEDAREFMQQVMPHNLRKLKLTVTTPRCFRATRSKARLNRPSLAKCACLRAAPWSSTTPKLCCRSTSTRRVPPRAPISRKRRCRPTLRRPTKSPVSCASATWVA
jgi:hypothetical protein